MPIKPENKARYGPPKEWKATSDRIRGRDGHRCKFCGVANYAVGHWQADQWVPIGGNAESDNLGAGYGTYKEAADYRNLHNQLLTDEPRLIVIVLTCAHLDYNVDNMTDENLASLCQRCHNRHDQPFRKANARQTITRKKGQLALFQFIS